MILKNDIACNPINYWGQSHHRLAGRCGFGILHQQAAPEDRIPYVGPTDAPQLLIMISRLQLLCSISIWSVGPTAGTSPGGTLVSSTIWWRSTRSTWKIGNAKSCRKLWTPGCYYTCTNTSHAYNKTWMVWVGSFEFTIPHWMRISLAWPMPALLNGLWRKRCTSFRSSPNFMTLILSIIHGTGIPSPYSARHLFWDIFGYQGIARAHVCLRYRALLGHHIYIALPPHL